MQKLFEAVRAACARRAWSVGVEIVRADGVVCEREEPSEVTFRVAAPGRIVSPTVILYPKDLDWECDCPEVVDPCAHVAAAAIALKRGLHRQAADDVAEARGRVRYDLAFEDGGLHFERIIVSGAREALLRTPLAAVASGRVDGPPVAATRADLEVERALGTRLRGRLPRGVLHGLLRPLSGCPDVRLDGEPVQVSPEPARIVGVLRDFGEDFELRLEREPRVTRSLSDDLVQCGETLRPLAGSGLSGRDLEDYRSGRRFRPDELLRLVTEVLPLLREQIEVRIETDRLPESRRERPRILIQVEREGEGLAVLPLLVYGDPPLARVDAGRLVHLQGPVPLRDPDGERRVERELRQRLELIPGHRWVVLGDAAIALATKLDAWPGGLRGRAHEAFFRAPELVPRFTLRSHGFDLRFEAGGDGPAPGSRADAGPDAERVLRAWREGHSYLRLEGGGLAPLPDDWLARHGDSLADLLAARDAEGKVPPCLLPALAQVCDDLDQPRPPEFERLETLIRDFSGLPEVALPQDLRGELRGYQREGVNWLCFLRDARLGGLLADDMGIGKTLQALCALKGRCLVVCPTSVLHNWVDEAHRFRPALRVAVYHGPGRTLDPAAELTVTSYALLRLDQDALSAVEWSIVVLDEAQAIKNADSQVARAAYRLSARSRFALTGTPVENRLEELWSEIHFTNPGLLGGRRDFDVGTARPMAAGDVDAGERLRRRIRPFLLRRRKGDVLPELPPRQDIVLHAVLSEEERVVYDTVRAASVPAVVERLRGGGGVMQALEALLRLRQACCHPALVPGQHAGSSAKLELLLGRLDTAVADGHKALVFSQWTSLLDLVEPLLDEATIPWTRLDGSTRDRPAVLTRFADSEGPPVLLISLRAGGTGLNLTSADHVFLLDPWWNPAVEDQAADRAHRIGQERPVLVHRLVAENTVEERILELQDRKRGLAAAVLGEGVPTSGLTRDDLLALLE